MSATKNKRWRVSKKKFLLSSKKYWLIEDKLLPVFSHLVESYSDQLKDTWAVKVEESQFGSLQIKEEPTDEIDYDAPMILPAHEACINFPPLASCYKAFWFYNCLFSCIPSQKCIPSTRINNLLSNGLSYS